MSVNTKESLHEALRTFGVNQRPNVATVASAATIAPTTFFTVITGTTDISTITPPYADFQGMLALVFSGATPPDIVTGGNIALTKSPVQYEVVLVAYIGTLWYPVMT